MYFAENGGGGRELWSEQSAKLRVGGAKMLRGAGEISPNLAMRNSLDLADQRVDKLGLS